MLAERDLDWHAATGQQVVHCGGTAHLLVGDPRLVPPDHTHTNAGGLLRRELGTGFAVLALTVGAGAAPFPVPSPPPDYVEHVFADVETDAALLDLATAADGPPPVRDWARRPISTRMIGPAYDPARDHESRIDTGPLTEAIDVIVHIPRFRSATPIEAPVPDGST